MKLLIGYDGSAAANDALRDLEKAGIPGDAQVKLVHAITPMLPLEAIAPESGAPGWYAKAYKKAQQDAKKTEAEALRSCEKASLYLEERHPGWTVWTETCFEVPAEALLKRADAWKSDLILVGNRGWSALGKLILGSVAEKVLRHAKGDVRLGKKSGSRKSYSRILIAYDGSRHADAALAHVAARAWAPGTQVRLVAVADFRLRVDEIFTAMKKNRRGKARPSPWPWMERKLAKASEQLAERGLEHSSIIIPGEPRKVLLSEAKSFHADAIFLGPRGLSGVERFFLGSVSSAIAAHAPCSVEIIRTMPKGRKS